MGILKSLGLKDKDQPQQGDKPSAQDQARAEKDPHRHGGCCGSCGGHKRDQEQR